MNEFIFIIVDNVNEKTGFFDVLQNKDYFKIFITVLSSFLGAFFAFCLFVFSERIKEKNERINILNAIHEYLAMFNHYYSAFLEKSEFIKEIEVPSITLHRLGIFPIEEYVFQRLPNFKVSSSLIVFISRLRLLNTDIVVINEFIQIVSQISKDVLCQREENNYKDTLEDNKEKLFESIDKILENLEKLKKENSILLAKVIFTKKYEQSSFFKKIWFSLRFRINPEYRKKKIKECEIKT
ncbi:MAG: hypothetical protein KAT32_03380 [Candidatus Moranbacteria bacterium]|nr:hypothetical protein [Candidatus Moranbacteria bacterium]